jgi:hypothetical protein
MARSHSSGAPAAPSPALNISAEIAKLQPLTVGQLAERYAELFGEAAHSRNKVWLIKRIAWRLQANAYGGLSERALARAQELANDADLRVVAPRAKPAPKPPQAQTHAATLATGAGRVPPVGSVIAREYKGRTLCVTVLANGFEFEGEVYKTLSALAKHITGSHCNGYLFFRLTGKAGAA